MAATDAAWEDAGRGFIRLDAMPVRIRGAGAVADRQAQGAVRVGAVRGTTQRDQDRRLIARGKPPCALCDQPIDYSLTTLPGSHGKRCKGGTCAGCTPHPMRFEVDHIIPIDPSKHSPEEQAALDVISNKQPSHRDCNRRKWHRTAEDTAPRTFETWRTW